MKKGRWTAIGIIIAALALIWPIYIYLIAPMAKLNALVKQDKVEIPTAYGEYLHTVDSPIVRQNLIIILDTVEPVLKQQKNPYTEVILGDLRNFAGSSPIFTSGDPVVTTVKISNVGRKMANNVKVFLPTEGFVRATKDGESVVNQRTDKGWIELFTLEPSSQFIVNFWTSGYVRDIRVVSDAGTVQVRPWYVSREDHRWIVGFGLDDIVFWGISTLLILGVVLLAILVPFGRRLERIEAQERLSKAR